MRERKKERLISSSVIIHVERLVLSVHKTSVDVHSFCSCWLFWGLKHFPLSFFFSSLFLRGSLEVKNSPLSFHSTSSLFGYGGKQRSLLQRQISLFLYPYIHRVTEVYVHRVTGVYVQFVRIHRSTVVSFDVFFVCHVEDLTHSFKCRYLFVQEDRLSVLRFLSLLSCKEKTNFSSLSSSASFSPSAVVSGSSCFSLSYFCHSSFLRIFFRLS